MEGPRQPVETEWNQLVEFLNKNLRADKNWSIINEYPTALNPQNLHNIRIFKNENSVVSHAVVKPLVVKSPHVIFKVAAIGSVITDEGHREQGLSKQIIKDCVQLAERQNCDLAILWTNLFDFYRKMNFELAGSEISFIIDKTLNEPQPGVRFSADSKVAAEAILRLYSQHSVASARTLDETKKFLSIPQTKIYTAWDLNNQLVAYAIEGKGADLGGYIHEWGGSVTHLTSLLSFIYKTTNSVKTLIVPRHSANLIQKLKSYNLVYNEGFLGMIRILAFDQLSAKIKRAFRTEGCPDIVLEKRNDLFVFGIGAEIVTISAETDLTRLLFGPVDYKALDMFSDAALAKIEKVLPLPLWIWGWDSV